MNWALPISRWKTRGFCYPWPIILSSLKPAYYDDELVVETKITALPTARIEFEYETKRAGELLNTARTTLVFVDKQTGRPMRCPNDMLEAMKIHFS